MISNTVALFKNRAKVCREFVAVAPVRFFFDVVFGFAKSILELFVFILPIKIVLILAAPQMPVMFDRFIPGVTRGEWAGILTGLIVVLHICVLILDWYLKRSARNYTDKFSALHKKGRFADSGFLTSVYSGIVDTRTGTLVLLALSIVVGIVYLDFLLFFFLALSVAIIGAISLASIFDGFRAAFIKRPPDVLGKISNLIFISCFCYLVYAFILSESRPEFLQGVVSIILSRRLLGAVSQKAGNLVWFNKQKAAIQKLFYRGHTALIQGGGNSRAFIDNVTKASLPTFANRVLENVGFAPESDLSCEWIVSPIQWMNIVQCAFPAGDSTTDKVLVLKVYEPNKARVAKNELEVYPELEAAGVIPKFIGMTEVDGYQVQVHQMSSSWEFTKNQDVIAGIRRKFLPLQFDDALIEEYCSVHPILVDRMTASLLSRLYLIPDNEVTDILDSFKERLPEISSRIKDLPLLLLPPDPFLKLLTVNDGEQEYLLGLGEWRIEPIGFSMWPADSAEDMLASLPCADSEREDFDRSTLMSSIQMCSLLTLLEKHCRSGRLYEGVDVVTQLMNMTEVAEDRGELQAVTV
ncbi:hypothetical protein [Microbulbifer sp. MCCC 1A16149]|uniref:hypothetical protein n=1 Tax=Microbulbifer sp. MCCC 1A16149 TaxID=3411322 RepID=UPI003D0F34BF